MKKVQITDDKEYVNLILHKNYYKYFIKHKYF